MIIGLQLRLGAAGAILKLLRDGNTSGARGLLAGRCAAMVSRMGIIQIVWTFYLWGIDRRAIL